MEGFGSLCCWGEAAGLGEGRWGWWRLSPVPGRWKRCCWCCLPLCRLCRGCRLAQAAPGTIPSRVGSLLSLLTQRQNKLIVSLRGAAGWGWQQGDRAAGLAEPVQDTEPLLQPACSLCSAALHRQGHAEPATRNAEMQRQEWQQHPEQHRAADP